MRSLSRVGLRGDGRGDGRAVQTMPVLADSLGARSVLSLVVKPLGERRGR
jgi:hypothetical protein